jgi:hypothetical protein
MVDSDSRGAVLVCDVATSKCVQQWRVTTCDRAFSALSGSCRDSLLGRDLQVILHPAPVLQQSTSCCGLQQSTHWFAYAPDLPPVVMTTTLLPSELVLRTGGSSDCQDWDEHKLVACHFRRFPDLDLAQTMIQPSSVPYL